VASFLAGHGFAVHSLSDVVREAATASGLSHTRENLIAVGVRLRQEGGPGALAARILDRLGGRAVVDSIRSPGEVAVLRGLPRFVLLGVDAPIDLRFERSVRRGRAGDGTTLEGFARNEALENSATEFGQQLRETLSLADRVVRNDGTLEDLRERTRRALAEIGVALGPPPGGGADPPG
jgi:dephospho-CoA kinase